MALHLEPMVFSQDPFQFSNYCSKDPYDQIISSQAFLEENHVDRAEDPFLYGDVGGFNEGVKPSSELRNVSEWDHCPDSSPDAACSFLQYLTGETFPPLDTVTAVKTSNNNSSARRKRRRRVTKNKEEVENQRMTHIAVERNRRKQMNEYLAVIRAHMPASYAQRGDQASIVGGAINYVKELEQLLQSLEAKNRIINSPQNDPQNTNISSPFSDFFTFPQYSTRPSNVSHGNNDGDIVITSPQDSAAPATAIIAAAVGEIEVTMVDSHANVKILAKKQPKQLLKLVNGFQRRRLSVLHLNVTSTVDHMVLHSFSLKVEEGSHLSSTDDIAAAANHILHEIQEEARST
ncbi:hypothetical protein Drorol1_Dr00000023 [Drosera rotundifolia]